MRIEAGRKRVSVSSNTSRPNRRPIFVPAGGPPDWRPQRSGEEIVENLDGLSGQSLEQVSEVGPGIGTARPGGSQQSHEYAAV